MHPNPFQRYGVLYLESDDRLGARDLQVNEGLALCLIFGVNNLVGFILVCGLQAGAFASFGVNAIESPIADTAPDQAVACFHAIFHATARINQTDSAVLASSGRVTARYPESLRSTEIGVRFGVRFGRPDS
jgi:hypothetical protein